MAAVVFQPRFCQDAAPGRAGGADGYRCSRPEPTCPRWRHAQSRTDVLELLAATAEMADLHPETPVITMSMGTLGAVSRLAGEVLALHDFANPGRPVHRAGIAGYRKRSAGCTAFVTNKSEVVEVLYERERKNYPIMV